MPSTEPMHTAHPTQTTHPAPFNYNLDYEHIDFHKHPELYRIGKGEQGVLLVEPYKSEILPYWRFRTPEVALASAKEIYARFRHYLRSGDIVGADMARKFLQMGFTRARRYANHKGGRKYDKATGEELPRTAEDPVKAEAARIFYEYYVRARENTTYVKMKHEHQLTYG